MGDDKSKRGPADRRRVAGGEDYEVAYLMKAANISKEEALRLIKEYDGDREKIMQALAAKGV